MLKIKVVDKAFDKMAKVEFGPDGYACIDKVIIEPDGNLITIKGVFGEFDENDCSNNWNEEFELYFNGRKSLEYLKGMFYKEIEKVL